MPAPSTYFSRQQVYTGDSRTCFAWESGGCGEHNSSLFVSCASYADVNNETSPTPTLQFKSPKQ
eukprot:766513-Hanusia_phi.AAC.6